MYKDKLVVKLKCEKHPGFDPLKSGEEAIRGNCTYCHDMLLLSNMIDLARTRMAMYLER